MSGVPCGSRAWLMSSWRSSSDGSEPVGRRDMVEAAVIDLVRPHSLLVKPAVPGFDVAVELLRNRFGRAVYASAISDEEYSSGERVGESESRLPDDARPN